MTSAPTPHDPDATRVAVVDPRRGCEIATASSDPDKTVIAGIASGKRPTRDTVELVPAIGARATGEVTFVWRSAHPVSRMIARTKRALLGASGLRRRLTLILPLAAALVFALWPRQRSAQAMVAAPPTAVAPTAKRAPDGVEADAGDDCVSPREAADALVEGRPAEALEAYLSLSRCAPVEPVYAAAARILERTAEGGVR